MLVDGGKNTADFRAQYNNNGNYLWEQGYYWSDVARGRIQHPYDWYLYSYGQNRAVMALGTNGQMCLEGQLAFATNAQGNATSIVTFDFNKPAELLITNANFVISGFDNLRDNVLNHGYLLISNSGNANINFTVGTGIRVDKPQGLNMVSTMVITNSTLNSSVARAEFFVWKLVSTNVLFFPSQ
jgi:hypothetical protein